MTRASTLARAAAFALVAVATSVGAEPPAAAGATGEQWEVTTQMSMQGFGMPAQTHRECRPTGAQEPAGASGQPGCTSSGFEVAGDKTTWRVECAGPPAMSGTGEITRSGPDAYAGKITFSSEEGEMVVDLSGRRVGTCTPSAR